MPKQLLHGCRDNRRLPLCEARGQTSPYLYDVECPDCQRIINQNNRCNIYGYYEAPDIHVLNEILIQTKVTHLPSWYVPNQETIQKLSELHNNLSMFLARIIK